MVRAVLERRSLCQAAKFSQESSLWLWKKSLLLLEMWVIWTEKSQAVLILCNVNIWLSVSYKVLWWCFETGIINQNHFYMTNPRPLKTSLNMSKTREYVFKNMSLLEYLASTVLAHNMLPALHWHFRSQTESSWFVLGTLRSTMRKSLIC